MSQTKAQLIDNLVQPITGALGSASAPTFSFTADPNTGIYSPGADQLAISTGGSGRLFVDASGNVGLGTAVPDLRLDVTGQARIGSPSSVNFTLNLGRTGVGTTRSAFLSGVSGDVTLSNQENGYLAFNTNNSERLRITAAGLLGLQTSAPEALLQIGGGIVGSSATFKGALQLNGAPSSLEATSGLEFKTSAFGSGYGWKIDSLDTGGGVQLQFGTRQNSATWTNVMRLDASGRVGIGNTNPGYPLDILSESTGATLRIRGSSGGTSQIQFTDNAVSTQWSAITNSSAACSIEHSSVLRFITASSERLRIASGGAVGIGTSSPSATLHVAGATRTGANDTSDAVHQIGAGATGNRNAYVDLVGDTTYSTYGTRLLRLGGANAQSQLLHRGTGSFDFIAVENAAITFNTTNTERARIDSSGRLLVGTSSEIFGGRLETVQTAANANLNLLRFTANTSGTEFNIIKSRGATAGTNTIVQDNDDLARINFKGADGSTYIDAARITAGVDGTPGANDMPGRLVFSTTADGASSPTERMRIHSTGSVSVGTTAASANGTNTGIWLRGDVPSIQVSRSGGSCGNFYRLDSDGAVFTFSRDATQVGSISVTTTATAYNTSSDYRLKENVIAVTDGITRLQQLKPSRFNFIADPTKTVDGFIAHEVQSVVPEAITGEKDAVDADGNPEYQGIDQSKLVPLLTAALQEAIGEIESLKARVAALESA